jgi:drug/metabolite transporter (DMT)-like permease
MVHAWLTDQERMSMATSSPAMTGVAWALLVLLSVLWGATFFFWKVLVAYLPPFTVVFGRVAIAAVVLTLVLALRGEVLPLSRAAWRRFATMAALNNAIPFALIAYGETRIASGIAAILNATTPLFSVLVAHALTNEEKLTPSRVFGIGAGFTGVIVMVEPDLPPGGFGANMLAEVACLLASLSYAFAGVYGRRFGGLSALTAATGQLTAASVLMLPFVLIVDRPWLLPSPPVSAWLSLIVTAVLCTAAAYPVYFRLLALAGATNLLLVTFLLPITSLLLGTLLLHEAITPQALGGMALIGVGLAAIDGRLMPRLALRSG